MVHRELQLRSLLDLSPHATKHSMQRVTSTPGAQPNLPKVIRTTWSVTPQKRLTRYALDTSDAQKCQQEVFKPKPRPTPQCIVASTMEIQWSSCHVHEKGWWNPVELSQESSLHLESSSFNEARSPLFSVHPGPPLLSPMSDPFVHSFGCLLCSLSSIRSPSRAPKSCRKTSTAKCPRKGMPEILEATRVSCACSTTW